MKLQLEISRKGVLIIGIILVLGIGIFSIVQNWQRIKGLFPKTKNNLNTTISSELTTEEITTISKSIAAVQCTTFQTVDHKGLPVFGSGTYLTYTNPNTQKNIDVLLTNAHVAEDPTIGNSKNVQDNCIVTFNKVNGGHYYYFNKFYGTTVINDDVDIAILTPEYNNGIEKENQPLDKGGEPIPTCGEVATGKKVYIFGYPSSSDSFVPSPDPGGPIWSKEHLAWYNEIDDYRQTRNLILSEGIISGNRGSNYFTTAKIDAGNSGGLAVSKENGLICIIGIPTWVSVGQYDTLGVIQPIQNVIKANINWSKLSERESL